MAPGRDRDPLIAGGLPTQYVDVDPDETAEWVESFDNLVDTQGNYRARYLMLSLLRRAAERNVGVPSLRSTDYINTISPLLTLASGYSAFIGLGYLLMYLL